MKIALIFILSAMSFQAMALGDLERGILFLSNATSAGTFLPGMEAEMEKIRLEHEKKKAELQLQMEKNSQNRLYDLLTKHIESLTKLNQSQEKILNLTLQEREPYVVILEGIERLYSSKINLKTLIDELHERSEILKSLGKHWDSVVIESMISIEDANLSSEEVNALLLTALDRKSEYDVLIGRIESNISLIVQDISIFEKRREGLK